jgi:TPR repeat protein
MTATDIALRPPLDAAARPWPGLDAFSEALQAFFFGRAAETEQLFRRIRGETVTLLFGQSGLGKTSLLRAGLTPRLRAAFLPVFLRLDYAEGAPSPSAQVKAEFEREAAAVQAEVTPIDAEETLWGYFHRADRIVTSRAGEPLVPVVIFDQFEEMFTLGLARESSRAAAQRFLVELAELIENRPPDGVEKAIESDPAAIEKYHFDRQDYRIVIALREDFLAQLDSVRERAPLIGRNRFRLRRMTGRQGFDAVTRPVPGLIAPELAREILRFVGRPDPEDAFGPADGEGGDGLEVEPALLSLVCRELNERRLAFGLDRVTPDLLAGNRESIIQSFYDTALADQKPAVREFIEDELLSESGFRESVSLDRARRALAAAEVPTDALDTLVSRRLLRIEERLDVARVEIIHDVVVPIIRASRDSRHVREAEAEANWREAEAERQSREREEAARREVEFFRERRRKRQAYAMLAVMAVMIVTTACLGLFAWQQRVEADRQRAIAEALAKGSDYLSGTGLVPKDYKEAMRWYRTAADQGSAPAQFSVGAMYNFGYGVKLDYAEALRWYRKSAEQGYTAAFVNLGSMYTQGQGVPPDYAEGLQWFLKAADQGFVDAQNVAGSFYEEGRGVQRDYVEAMRWYQKAAAQDYGLAQNNIGHLYEKGDGVEQDDAAALRWYRKAADHNIGRAQYHIGMFYAEGRGVPRDLGEAHAWMEEARSNGNSDAFNWLALHPLDASDGDSYLTAEEQRLAAARTLDDNLQSDDSRREVGVVLFKLSWALTLNKRPADALAQADEAMKVFPSATEVEVKRADALLLLGRFDEAKKIYLADKDKNWGFGKSIADVIHDDFAQMRKFGIDTPDMKRIEVLLAN